MSKDEKGFFDGLVEDFAASLEMKAAIEASRDENGKVDKWKATGLAMGLGHTSDDDIAMMGAMLGAEGAFDEDTDSLDYDLFDDFSTPVTSVQNYSVPKANASPRMTDAEYESKKAGILSEKKFIIVTAVIGLFLFTALFLYMMGTQTNYTGVYLLLMGVLDISLVFAISNTSQARERELTALEKQYRESKRIEEEKKKEKQAREELKNFANSNNIEDVINQIREIMKKLFDNADQASGITEPTFHDGMLHAFLSGLIYCAVKECDIALGAKVPLFDYAVSKANITSDFYGNALFPECQQELDETLKKLVNEIFTSLTIAAYKFSNPDDVLDFTKTVCSLMFLLDESIKAATSYAGFEKAAVSVTLKEAEKAAQRVFDERLLDQTEPPDTQPDFINDSFETDTSDRTGKINMDSIMGKVNNLVSDKSFLSKKLVGREFEITCDACGKAVNIVVTEQLTGICPSCGHENELNFSIK